MLSQYGEGTNPASKILVGYSAYRLRENYFADFVSYILGLEQDNRKDKFDCFKFRDVFPDDATWQRRLDNFARAFAQLKPAPESNGKRIYASWIDCDYWISGLMYWIVFKDKSITINDSLKSAINKEVQGLKEDQSYSRTPNQLNNLRSRIKGSIEIYGQYAH